MEHLLEPSALTFLVLGAALVFALRFPPPPTLVAPLLTLLVAGIVNQGTSWLWSLDLSPEGHWRVVLWHYSSMLCWTTAWLLLSFQFSELQGHPSRLGRRWTMPVIAGAAVLWWLVLATNPWHELLLTPRPGEVSEPRVLYPAFFLWQIVGGFVASVTYLRLTLRVGSRHVRARALALAAGAPLTWLGGVLALSFGTVFADMAGIFTTTMVLLILAGIYGTRLFALSSVGLHQAIRHQTDAILILDDGGLLLYANDAAEKMLGPEPLVLDAPVYPLLAALFRLPDPAAAPLQADTLRYELEQESAAGESLLFRSNERWIRAVMTPIPGAMGRVSGRSLLLSDHTPIHQATKHLREREAALRASDERYRVLFEESPLGVAVIDRDLEITSANGALARLIGAPSPENLIGLSIAEIPVAAEADCLALLDGPDGSRAPVTRERLWVSRWDCEVNARTHLAAMTGASGAIEGLQAILEDIREQRQLHDELLQARKMEALGQLAGGIAHDFNNQLTVIMGNADVLRRRLGAEHSLSGRVNQIINAAERSAALTKQLLTFGRKQLYQPKVVDVAALLRGLDGMLGPLLGAQVTIETILTDAPLWTKAEPAQLETVFVNLSVNARDAMPTGGTLLVRAYHSNPPDNVVIEVTDTGEGMDDQTKSRIFEPFFTTKELGKGTGLGLATVYGIVRQSGGSVAVESKPGLGTTVRVQLPSALAMPDPNLEEIPTILPRGSGTIVVAEDEARLRSLAKNVLEEHGYAVLEAADGCEALERARAHRGTIDLLVTDVIMPTMGGVDLVKQMRAERPQMRILYISGYVDKVSDEQHLIDSGAAFLPKPFTPRQLLMRVSEQLQPRAHERA